MMFLTEQNAIRGTNLPPPPHIRQGLHKKDWFYSILGVGLHLLHQKAQLVLDWTAVSTAFKIKNNNIFHRPLGIHTGYTLCPQMV
jgi:hypothetical protein